MAGRFCSDSTSLRGGVLSCGVQLVATSPTSHMEITPGEWTAVPVVYEWDEARALGWITASGELSGTGSRHAGDHGKRGILE